MVGDEYVLKSCPTGYRFYNLSLALQECQPCPRGAHCEAEQGPCQMCVDCQPGYYKDTISNHSCVQCPVNSYGPEYGATSLSRSRRYLPPLRFLLFALHYDAF
eukprot:295604-Rhodomonas_salina.4